MLSRADAVLAAIPILAVSGFALRTIIASTGVATGLLAAPLTPAGLVASLAFVFWELLVGRTPKESGDGRV